MPSPFSVLKAKNNEDEKNLLDYKFPFENMDKGWNFYEYINQNNSNSTSATLVSLFIPIGKAIGKSKQSGRILSAPVLGMIADTNQ